ncbi:class II aldolase/adducin-like [Striga asiatica]|uniref:Class II aldolase/adducin-like n=1 Tax=Striga asiatica TaxID=4170 RepID=A0A5A7Q0P6_STRAF|nr:class II aldolase/adducin-like [Striga asiatica]
MARFWLFTRLSFPVDFQYPARVARFVLNPFGLAFVEIDFGNNVELDFEALNFPFQVIVDELLIGGVKPKTGRQSHRSHRQPANSSSPASRQALFTKNCNTMC